ncbi:transmembrane protein 156 [Fukomys damarensis]|uniref:transmembrane protein 156 n=1 Tax=Fukomys damarensis TaxID=885580 RepID=UPI00053FDA79|nr:transmembrane protein 156 [Fukomys damarensis]XP_033614824.1 transmembrane protein 156 [Fukomys damarensis]
MTKTVLLKLLVAIVITFILILPEYFKTSKGRLLELSCLEGCLKSNITYSLSSLNYSFVTFLQPERDTPSIKGLFLHCSNFQNFTSTCQEIISEFKMCSLCLVCESKGNVDFISQKQASKVLIMRRSMGRKAKDFFSPCQHFNFSVTAGVDQLEESNTTRSLRGHPRKPATVEEEPPKENFLNETCRITEYPNNCSHVSLLLEMDIKNITCSMKTTWYILVLLVFIFWIILMIHKILEGHRRVQKLQNHKDTTASVHLRGSNSEKLRALNVRVIPEATRVKEVLPPIPELEAASSLPQ